MKTPIGTVTFLFTDIEGSTGLWESHPEEMRTALAQHDAIMRAAVERNNGCVFRTLGDSFCASFHTAPQALQAALESQLALSGERWPKNAAIIVRMALHTGAAEFREGDYYGQPLNRVARLMATAHGGQVVLSDVTCDLCHDTLPEGVSLKSLGEHRLKDLGRPEPVFQLCHKDLKAEFPPLRSLKGLPNNLPQQVTSFIGREKQIAEVKALLKKCRLLTLTGTGGTGKTRLGLQVAADLLDTYKDGAWFVELAALSDAALIPHAVATVFGLKDEPGEPVLKTLVEYLKSKQLLLLLDNCEHLVSACAQLADSIMRACPDVGILASSREALGIAGETTYRVPSMAFPDPNMAKTPESLIPNEAVRLFVDRAEQVEPGFQVTTDNATALAAVCRRLDGIPLAIELAAARVRSLSVQEVNQRLDERFKLLTGGSRTALPRQQTLRSLIDWSYDLLNESERDLLNRLSVFNGGWILQAAELTCTDESVVEWDVLNLLTSLSDKSLVLAEPRNGVTRYRLLETVRQYAHDRLVESGAQDRWRDRHMRTFLNLAESAEPHLRDAEQQVWIDRLDADHDNFVAALNWSLLCPPENDSALRLCAALYRFWYVRGHFAEGRQWCVAALGHCSPESSAARAKALNGAGVLAFSQGDRTSARTYHDQSLEICRQLDDARGVAGSLNNLGMVAYEEADYETAQEQFEGSLKIWRELNDPWGIANSLNNLGSLASNRGDYGKAREMYEESLGIWRQLGDQWGIANSLNNLGTAAREQGDLSAAAPLFVESLAIQKDLGDRWGIAVSLEDIASLIAMTSTSPLAPQLWGAAEALREEIGSPLLPVDRLRVDAQVAAARNAWSDDTAFNAAWAVGRATAIEKSVELALMSSPVTA